MTTPPRNAAPTGGHWQQRAHDLTHIYQKLEPQLAAIRTAEPATGELFDQFAELVNGAASAATVLDKYPSVTHARGLRNKRVAATPGILKQVEAVLYEHHASSGHISLCWSIEEQLGAMYTAAEDLIESQRPIAMVHGVVLPTGRTVGHFSEPHKG